MHRCVLRSRLGARRARNRKHPWGVAAVCTAVGFGAMSCGGGEQILGGTSSTGPLGETACAGDIAAKAFRFALCSCGDFAWSQKLTTDSFNATTGAKGSNASIGVDGRVTAGGAYDIGGSLWIAAEPKGLGQGLVNSVIAASRVLGDLRVASGATATGPQAVNGDLYSDGSFFATNMQVGGAVHVPAGTFIAGVASTLPTVFAPVAIREPCDCATQVLNVPALVTRLAVQNDNAAAGFAATELNGFSGPKALELPRGRYYFEALRGSELTLRLEGKTEIAVLGDVDVSGSFAVELAAGAELDLFVGGSFNGAQLTSFGDTAAPSRIRMYSAGSSVALGSGMQLGANIYAPGATIACAGSLEMSGSLFASRFAFTGEVTIHYDEAVLELEGCEAAGKICSDCNGCGKASPACVAGTCAACQSSDDCCAPLQCQNGRCVLTGP